MTGPLDKTGREIHEGDIIIYGHSLGRSAGLRIGKVLRVVEAKKRWASDPGFHLEVRGVDDDWRFEAPKMNKKNGTLLWPNRTVVIPECWLPQSYQEILRGVPLLV